LELASRRSDVAQGLACVDGGLIELHEWFPSWEACLAALTPPRLDHLTLDALAPRIRSFSPELPARAVCALLHCFRVGAGGTTEPRLAREPHLQLVRALWEPRPSTRPPGLALPLLLVLADTGDAVRTAQKRQAETRALGLAPRVRSRWFAPAHHDVHA